MSRFPLLSLALAALFLAGPAYAQTETPTGAPHPQAVQEEAVPDWQARLELAQLLTYSKRYEEALVQYDKVLAQRPDSREALLGKAQTLSWMGRSEESAAILAGLPQEELGPEQRLLLADVAVARKDYAAAEYLLRGYLAEQPGDHRARLRLAEVLSWTERFQESLAEYETILAALPEDKQVIRKYAQVLSWAGRTDEAIEQLQKTLE